MAGSFELKVKRYNLTSDMRRDVQEIFRLTPHEKQVMMFSATLSKDVRPICKKFMQDVITTHPSRQVSFSSVGYCGHGIECNG